MFAIKPDYRIAVRQDILDEVDGPMLLHGLQRIDNIEIVLPARRQDRPDRDRLDQRYQEFRRMAELIVE
jgi:putative restriction endonuclease